MDGQRQVAHLVEKNSAPRGAFEETRLVAIGAGESAPLVAEKLTLGERLGQGRAVDAQERTVAPLRPEVERGGRQVLPGARLADDHHGKVARGEALELRVHMEHDRIGDEDRPLAELEHETLGGNVLIGWVCRSGGLFFEDRRDVAEHDDVAIAKGLFPREPLAVDTRAVAAAEIFDDDARAVGPEDGVPPRDAGRIDENVGWFGASDDGFADGRKRRDARGALQPDDETMAFAERTPLADDRRSGRVAEPRPVVVRRHPLYIPIPGKGRPSGRARR